MSRANGWAGLLHARAAGCVIGHSARQSEIGVMMMQWRGEAQRALLGYHESKKPDFSAYIFLTSLGQSHPGGGTPCPILPRVAKTAANEGASVREHVRRCKDFGSPCSKRVRRGPGRGGTIQGLRGTRCELNDRWDADNTLA
jgi:hypothetical protein